MAQTTDICTIDDVAAHLHWNTSQQASYAPVVADYISAATPVIEGIVGPVVQRQFDEWYTAWSSRGVLELNYGPVVSVTSVTETFGANVIRTLTEQPLDGITPVDAFGYTADLEEGLIVRRVSGIAATFSLGTRNVHIVYQAGYCTDTASVPPAIKLGTIELIRTAWQPEQGGNRPGYSAGQGVDTINVAASAQIGAFVTDRVMAWLRPYVRNGPGVV